MKIAREQLDLLELIVDAYWARPSATSGQKIDFLVFTEGGVRGTFIQAGTADRLDVRDWRRLPLIPLAGARLTPLGTAPVLLSP